MLMGHTIPPKRNVIYAKLAGLMRFAQATREPYRSRFIGLIESAYQNISPIVYANLPDDEEAIIYAMLCSISLDAGIEEKEKCWRCISTLLTIERMRPGYAQQSLTRR